ncbi:MAG: DNA methyltransferase [Pseudomonadota bacterium]
MAKDYHEQNQFDLEPAAKPQGPVECLEMTFESDEKRRGYFLDKLREKLKDPVFRKIEGFPIGEDEDILSLSDPPYYTACPNPFIEDFIKHYGQPYDSVTDDYCREPFAADVSEGKNDPIYNTHSYHTKVPHRAIMRYILHYTEPGDVVYDGFCGTGMTGVAAQMCGDKATIRSLGYRVEKDGSIYHQAVGDNGNMSWLPFSSLGNRCAVLNDLSTIATFIAHNCNKTVSTDDFKKLSKSILRKLKQELGFTYETDIDASTKGEIVYTIWSEVHSCSNCGDFSTYWDLITDETDNYRSEMICPKCGAELNSRTPKRVYETVYDTLLGRSIRQLKWVPVRIHYKVGTKRFTKIPMQEDLAVLEEVDKRLKEMNIPVLELPHGDRWRRDALKAKGITYVHHFFTNRNLLLLCRIWEMIADENVDKRLAHFLMSWFTSTHSRLHRMNRYIPKHNRHVGPMSGTLYVSPLWVEISPFYFCEEKRKRYSGVTIPNANKCAITTGSANNIRIKSNSVDYIFTDPPFGFNIQYSELNLLNEAWLKVRTNDMPEAVINVPQNKSLKNYQELMELCFNESFRILKPGRWITVEFHNSQNAVWAAIQEAMLRAGFVVSDVRVLDKKKGTTKQLSLASTVKQDLIISAYKPNSGLEERFKLTAGTEDGVWDFVRTHLKQLPVFVSKDGQAEVIAERQSYLLFDRMVAFYVQRETTIPLSAAEFYAGLEQRFPPRDGMYFLPDQAAEYDKKRMTVREVLQLQIFVSDEESAIQWLKQKLTKKPQTAGDLKPKFMQEIGAWQKNEKMLELDVLLEQSFLRYDGKGNVPGQIHSYLSSNFKEFRNLEKDDPLLKAKAKDRWYVVDPNKSGDLEKLRERALMREFAEYRESKQKRLKVFRLEAVRTGFKKAWQERDYVTIIAVARKIPEKVLQEDAKLLMWYDQALTRSGEDA